MRILSFNTSTSELHVCLAQGREIIAEQIIICDADNKSKETKGRQFAASLIIPTLARLLKQTDWSKSSIEAIVVGVGPGSFTGIRIAVVTARTLAQALNLPLLGISEFECYAFKEQIKEFPALVALSAGKKQYYCAHINSDLVNKTNEKAGQLQVNWDITTHHMTEEDFQSHIVDFKKVAMLPENYNSSTKHSLNQAVNQAILAHHRLEHTDKTQPQLKDIFPYHLVKPLYIRSASITISSLNKTNES